MQNNPGSSSGRTEDSGSSNGGSNPSPGENNTRITNVILVLFYFVRIEVEPPRA